MDAINEDASNEEQGESVTARTQPGGGTAPAVPAEREEPGEEEQEALGLPLPLQPLQPLGGMPNPDSEPATSA